MSQININRKITQLFDGCWFVFHYYSIDTEPKTLAENGQEQPLYLPRGRKRSILDAEGTVVA